MILNINLRTWKSCMVLRTDICGAVKHEPSKSKNLLLEDFETREFQNVLLQRMIEVKWTEE